MDNNIAFFKRFYENGNIPQNQVVQINLTHQLLDHKKLTRAEKIVHDLQLVGVVQVLTRGGVSNQPSKPGSKGFASGLRGKRWQNRHC